MEDWYAYRYSYHGVVWFPFCLLVEAKLGCRLCRLDIADYQNTGLWVGNKDMGKKMSTLNILQVTDIWKMPHIITYNKQKKNIPLIRVCTFTAQKCLKLHLNRFKVWMKVWQRLKYPAQLCRKTARLTHRFIIGHLQCSCLTFKERGPLLVFSFLCFNITANWMSFGFGLLVNQNKMNWL